jgi:16S rRNA processing protein RimM
VDPDAWVPLAEIARPHGVRGEIRLKLFNVSSDVLLEQEEVLVRLKGGEEHEVSVERARRADDAILMKLYSVDDRDRAAELRGALICVRRRDFPPVADGEFYTIDLVGSEARLEGKAIGTISDVIEYPTVEVLVVKTAEGTWEVPFAEPYLAKVDAAAKVVELTTLDGLEITPAKRS